MDERVKHKAQKYSKPFTNFNVDIYIEESKVNYCHLKDKNFYLQLFSMEALIEEGNLYFKQEVFKKAVYKFLEVESQRQFPFLKIE